MQMKRVTTSTNSKREQREEKYILNNNLWHLAPGGGGREGETGQQRDLLGQSNLADALSSRKSAVCN